MGNKVLATTLFAALLVAGLLAELGVSSAKADVTTAPFCELFFVDQVRNLVTTTVTWRDASDAGTPFQFGDGAFTYVGGPAGTLAPLWHAYSYQVGGVTWYTQSVVFTGTDGVSTTKCEMPIVIDDRVTGTLTRKIYLPLVIAPPPQPPSLTMSGSTGPDWNEGNFHLVWSGAFATWHHLDLGDGSGADIWGASGDLTPKHWYTYPGGVFTATFTVTGQGGITTRQSRIEVHP
ncbi:hypothetical protein HY045_02965 [Candidatus Woesebacteria bacterium]|nr:hypothetical protein [Candidatus Woesebacteria bacterium]